MSDEFPLLYISMENPNVRSTIAYRIYKRAEQYYLEEVSTLKLVFDKPDIEVKEKKIVTSTKNIIEEVSEHNLNQIKGQMSLFD
jgi:hypothetical protein